MSLKSIRSSYSRLLTTFNDAGIQINESQKNDLDSFVLALESTMSKQRKDAIVKTKKAVTEKLEANYKTLFESIMKNVARNHELASKIQKASTQIEESKKIASKVSDYLDMYVESILPKKTIVDYDRMQKLEKIHESLKNSLLIDEDAVQEKKLQLEESFKKQKRDLETEVAKMQVKLNESEAKTHEMSKKLNKFKAMDLLEAKTRDLPAYEARKIKKQLAEASAEQIEQKFDETLADVREQVTKINADADSAVDEEINKILEADEEPSVVDAEIASDTNVTKDDEMFETIEQIDHDVNGNVTLDESEVIDPDLMKLWCAQSIEMK